MASIQKRKDSYRVRITRAGYATLSGTFKTRHEAIKWARNKETEIDTGVIKPHQAHSNRTLGNVTFEEAARYYERTHTSLKRNHRSESGILQILIKRWGSLPLSKIDKSQVALIRDELRSQGKAGSTVNHYLNAISVVYKMLADEWGMEANNPTAGIKRLPQSPSRVVRLSAKAEAMLIGMCKESSQPLLTPVVQLALETAMRRGELLALTWRDIDVIHRRIYINRSKNGSSRTVPASNRAIAIIESIPRTDDPRLFPIAAEPLRKHFERVVKRCASCWTDTEPNPFSDLHFHDLRHQALSQLSDKGLNVIELAQVSGHKTLAMLSRYTHPSHDAILGKIN